jgi:4-amino-4-deoxy-L-arabinose transferase-like glycosyltransferase
MPNRTRTDILLLAGFCGFLFFYGLAQFGLIGADEPRYAQVAREMLERRDWITPTLGGHPWLEKPPLYYWQAMLAYSIFGVSDWAARLPSALDATLLVLALYFFLRRFRPGFELDGSLIAASCAGIIGYAHSASTDMPLTAAFTIGMLAWLAWYESEKKIYLAAFYAFIALGVLAKGPVAALLAFLVICAFASATRRPRIILKSLWLPGIILFYAIALPWYFAVQARNPPFFHEFIVEHNLGRFSQNIYHHTEPFWYYVPVLILGLIPWSIFAVLGWIESIGSSKKTQISSESSPADVQFTTGIFAACWLIIPLLFFSLSKSKLAGYILPSIPAAALLLVSYLREHFSQKETKPVATWLAISHALFASASIVPALLIAYLVTQHRLPGGQPMLVALAIGFILSAGISLTLVRKSGLRMLRFVTLIPVVLTVGAALKLGAQPMDEMLSARPLAREIASVELHPLPVAVYHIRREVEYGLTFYRNHLTFNYDWGIVPQEEHLLVAPAGSEIEIAKLLPGRRVSYLGHYAAQHLDCFWVAAAAPPGN